MTDYYDPYGFEEYEEEDPYLDPQLISMLLGGGLPSGISTRVSDMGTPLPYDISTYAKQNNAFQDDLDIMFDPKFAALTSMLTGAPTQDYMQFVPGATGKQDPEPVAWTPTLDALFAGDPNEQSIATNLQSGMSPYHFNAAIRQLAAEGTIDEDQQADLIQMASAGWKELSDSGRAQAEWAGKPPAQSPLQMAYAKAGIPDPTEMYNEDTVPLNGLQTRSPILDSLVNTRRTEARTGDREYARMNARPENQTGMLSRVLAGRGGPRAGAQAANGLPRATVGEVLVNKDRYRKNTRPSPGAAQRESRERQARNARRTPAAQKRYTTQYHANTAKRNADTRDRDVRKIAAQQATAQGRSPASDAIRYKLEALRALRGY